MARPAYLDKNAADLVRLIKDGAIFLREVGATPPTGTSWTPQVSDSLLGYYSEEGYTLTPVPGDSTDLYGHNGDVLYSEQGPGWLTVKFSALEGNKRVSAAYFDIDEADIGEDGAVTVTKASNDRFYDGVVVGLDQKDRLIVAHYPKIKISEKDAITFNRTTLMAMGMTFRTFKGGSTAPYHMKAWGFALDDPAGN